MPSPGCICSRSCRRAVRVVPPCTVILAHASCFLDPVIFFTGFFPRQRNTSFNSFLGRNECKVKLSPEYLNIFPSTHLMDSLGREFYTENNFPLLPLLKALLFFSFQWCYLCPVPFPFLIICICPFSSSLELFRLLYPVVFILDTFILYFLYWIPRV